MNKPKQQQQQVAKKGGSKLKSNLRSNSPNSNNDYQGVVYDGKGKALAELEQPEIADLY